MGLGWMSAIMIRHDAGSRSCPPVRLGHDHPVVGLLIVVSGQMELTAGARRIRVGTGSGVFVEGDAPFAYVTRGEISYIAADLNAGGPEFQSLLPEPWEPIGALSLIAAASSFVAHAFSPADGPRAAAASADGQRAKVLAHIAEHHTDPRMNVATLAADFGLSTRSLQRLFVGREKGVAEEIAAARLSHAVTLLRDPLLVDATMEEIAARSGFGSVQKMRRAIHAATGRSPRELRVMRGDADERELRPHESRAVRDHARGVQLPVPV